MKKLVWIVLAVTTLTFIHTLPVNAFRGGHGGHSGHFGVGVVIGPGWGPGWWGPYYPYYSYPYYPYAAPVIPQQQEEYIQPAPQLNEQNYWYFCQNPEGYYPYVKKCPKGWMKVVPPSPPADQEE